MRVDFPAPLGPTKEIAEINVSFWIQTKGKGGSQRTDTDTGRKRDGAGSVGQLRLLGSRVSEGAVGHLEDGTSSRSNTHEGTGRRESELDDIVGEGVVGFAGRVLLDESGEVTSVVVELLFVVVNDVGADGIEETRVVGDDHRSDTGLSLEVCRNEREDE